jgi:hypothetical protein
LLSSLLCASSLFSFHKPRSPFTAGACRAVAEPTHTHTHTHCCYNVITLLVHFPAGACRAVAEPTRQRHHAVQTHPPEHTHIHKHTQTQTQTHIHTHTLTHTHTHTHTHTCTHSVKNVLQDYIEQMGDGDNGEPEAVEGCTHTLTFAFIFICTLSLSLSLARQLTHKTRHIRRGG